MALLNSFYKVDDRVTVLCLKDSDGCLDLILATDRDSHTAANIAEHSVQIVGIHQMNADNFICLIGFDPHSYFSWKISDYHIKSHNIDTKFLNHKAAYIVPGMIWVPKPAMVAGQLHLSGPGGQWCAICPKFIQYAESNLPNGDFICRSCRIT